uniref:Integrase catalytic domain-containing protein n=1 Tax=Vitis vinifera TaxID=29760 RepID=A5B1S7_VITVI|nr:hypothetical protein VITISV_026106 [Vitis vinifera]
MAYRSEEEEKKFEIWLWHRRLGHASFGYLKKLFPSLFGMSDISSFRCDICELAKSHHTSFPLILNKSSLPFMVKHSDLWGPSKVPTLSGSHWFLCLMKTKNEVNLFQNFHKVIETQYNAKVRVLRSDNGGEYHNSDLQKYLEGHGIIHQTTCSNTPQQNGVAKRKNRHLLEVVCASLIAAKMSISYWGEAITSVAYLINQVSSNSIDFQTPLQALTNVVVAPTVPNIPPRVFGCVAFVHLHKHQRTKLTSRALQCVFVGYALHKKGSMLPSSNLTNVYYNGCGKKPIGCRWIYTVKYKADGSIESFKVRLVAKGYTQTYGIDYTETFAPVAKINTVRLYEEVYMNLPPGCMVSETQCQKVCKLKKSLYGLKQSPREWLGRFTKSMRAFSYRQSNLDHILFLKKQHGKITALIVYVDDMVVTGNDPKERKTLQNYLSREFEMKDLGPLKYFLGIEVSQSSETGMPGCQPVDTPIEEGLKLCVEPNQVSIDKGKYQRLVGRLMYLAHTRPDLAYALSVVSQYMHNLGEQHMNAVMRILRYLKNAPGKGILFTKNVDYQSIEVYTDVDWAGAVDDRRSTSGYFTFVGGNLVTWKSKKQNVVARSSAEAEFRGMAFGLCEALWLRLLLQNLGYLSRQPIRLFCDNKAACDIAHNPVQHDRTKHVEVNRFFIKEKFDQKINWPISSPKLSQDKCSQNF